MKQSDDGVSSRHDIDVLLIKVDEGRWERWIRAVTMTASVRLRTASNHGNFFAWMNQQSSAQLKKKKSFDALEMAKIWRKKIKRDRISCTEIAGKNKNKK